MDQKPDIPDIKPDIKPDVNREEKKPGIWAVSPPMSAQ